MLRPHERLVWTHYAFHVNNAKQCSLQPSDDGHEPHVGGQGHFPQQQLRRKRPPNAVNGGALLPVLVVRIPTSANMLNTCTALSNRVGLSSQVDHVLATYGGGAGDSTGLYFTVSR